MAKKIDPMDGVELAEILKEAETYESNERSGKLPTARQQEEFHLLLRFALDVMGAPPRGYADDEQKDMENRSKADKRHKLKAKRKLVDVVRALKGMADEYPSLKKKYTKELGQLS